MHIAVQPAPVGVHRAQNVAAVPGIVEGLGEHFRATVGTGDFETRFQQLHGMEAGAGRDIQDLFCAVLLERADEEIAFGLRASVPVDQLVPFFDEGVHVLLFVLVCITDTERVVAVVLLNGSVFHGVSSRLCSS